MGMSPIDNAIINHESKIDVDPNHTAVSLYSVPVKNKQIPAQKRLPKSNQFSLEVKYRLGPSL